MTQPRPWPVNVENCRVDALRAAQEIQRIVRATRNMSAVDRRGIVEKLQEIEIQALLAELALTKARNGNGGTE